MQIDSVRCEVLNASYEPLSIVSGRRAFNLVNNQKASVLAEHPEVVIRSENKIHAVPTQILLNEMVKSRRTTRATAQLTQRNLFTRDKWTCQYCNRHRSELTHGEFLTRDHVIPQSKGGPDKWTNVVTACNKCNNKKADTPLKELMDMVLAREPVAPTVFEIWSKSQLAKAKGRKA